MKKFGLAGDCQAVFILTIVLEYDTIFIAKLKEILMEKELLDFNVSKHIDENERILWCANPVKKARLLPSERFNVLLGVFWTAFAVAWLVISLKITKNLPSGFSIERLLPSLAMPFLVVGLYFAFVMPLVIIVSRKGIEYALTTKRAIILYCGKKEKTFSYLYEDIKNLNFACDEQGNGYVTFMATVKRKNGKRSFSKIYGFYNVAKVKMLYKIFSSKVGEK